MENPTTINPKQTTFPAIDEPFFPTFSSPLSLELIPTSLLI
jgi:hypothetical protein